MKEIIQLLMAGAGSLGFAVLYNIRGKKLWVIAAGGIAAWGVYLATQQLTGNDYASSFTACVALTLYAEVMAIIFRTPVTVFLVSVAIPLIPGAPLYRAMNSLMHGSVEAVSYTHLDVYKRQVLCHGLCLRCLVKRCLW